MKIENSGVTITDVPGVDGIKVFPGGPILVDFGGLISEFSVETLAELHQAIGEALKHARQMSGAEAETAPRVFERDSDKPGPDVTKLRDVDGDIWVRAGSPGEEYASCWTTRLGAWPKTWDSVLDYAPLIEVRD